MANGVFSSTFYYLILLTFELENGMETKSCNLSAFNAIKHRKQQNKYNLKNQRHESIAIYDCYRLCKL